MARPSKKPSRRPTSRSRPATGKRASAARSKRPKAGPRRVQSSSPQNEPGSLRRTFAKRLTKDLPQAPWFLLETTHLCERLREDLPEALPTKSAKRR